MICCLLCLLALTGCTSPAYVVQAVRGHLQILSQARPINRVLADPTTPRDLADRLRLVLRLREFAANELRLPVDGHYQSYADLHRPFAVWTVSATPEFSLAAKTWWYPVVGSLEYRGFFSEQAARRHAERLERQGYDVHVGGVQAYSTLGWLRDPVLNTFVHDSEAGLADTLFHELAHQRVFAAGDTDFDEAFATTVAREGVRRWLRFTRDAPTLDAFEQSVARETRFMELIADSREQLAGFFPPDSSGTVSETDRGASRLLSLSAPPPEPPDPEALAQLRRRKAAVFQELRHRYQRVRDQEWDRDDSYDAWFRQPLNNARLNDVDTYYRLVPAFEALLTRYDGDLERFYRRVERIARLDEDGRLDALTSDGP